MIRAVLAGFSRLTTNEFLGAQMVEATGIEPLSCYENMFPLKTPPPRINPVYSNIFMQESTVQYRRFIYYLE